MRAPCSSAPRRSACRTATTGLVAVALAAAAAPASALAAPPSTTDGHAAAGSLIPSTGPLVASRIVDADANYAGVGVDGHGTLSLQTNALGNVSYYAAGWRKTVCGIRNFGLYYDAANSSGIPVDDAGIFVVSYTITYRSGGKRYTVAAIDSSQIGQFTDSDGVTRDMVVFRERVKVRRQRKGAKWCSGVHKKLFVGYRITQGA